MTFTRVSFSRAKIIECGGSDFTNAVRIVKAALWPSGGRRPYCLIFKVYFYSTFKLYSKSNLTFLRMFSIVTFVCLFVSNNRGGIFKTL